MSINLNNTGLSNQGLLEKLTVFQKGSGNHELTCGSPEGCEGVNTVLIPLEENGKIILKCPCGKYRQDHIPEAVLKF